jgi:hypothetical protein
MERPGGYQGSVRMYGLRFVVPARSMDLDYCGPQSDPNRSPERLRLLIGDTVEQFVVLI